MKLCPGILKGCRLNPTYDREVVHPVGWVEERNPTRDLAMGKGGGDRPNPLLGCARSVGAVCLKRGVVQTMEM